MSAHGGRPETIEDLRDVLLRGGFVPCDSAVCGCGSWHHRYGYPERMREIQELLDDAGHPLTNANGNLLRNAVAALIEERDALLTALKCALPHVEHAYHTNPDPGGLFWIDVVGCRNAIARATRGAG